MILADLKLKVWRLASSKEWKDLYKDVGYGRVTLTIQDDDIRTVDISTTYKG